MRPGLLLSSLALLAVSPAAGAAGVSADTCQEVTLDIASCEFVSLGKDGDRAAGRADEGITGLRINASALMTFPRACPLTRGSPRPESQQANAFFYRTEDASLCARWVFKTKSFWLAPRSCADVPRTGNCLPIEAVLLTEPPPDFPRPW